MCGMIGVEGSEWGIAEVMGTAQGAAEVGEGGVAQGLEVRPHGMAIGPPGSVQRGGLTT
jgi:hypothetical protein